jgi:hypothetical protein
VSGEGRQRASRVSGGVRAIGQHFTDRGKREYKGARAKIREASSRRYHPSGQKLRSDRDDFAGALRDDARREMANAQGALNAGSRAGAKASFVKARDLTRQATRSEMKTSRRRFLEGDSRGPSTKRQLLDERRGDRAAVRAIRKQRLGAWLRSLGQ